MRKSFSFLSLKQCTCGPRKNCDVIVFPLRLLIPERPGEEEQRESTTSENIKGTCD
jgi:hypothetical protein